ncbi:MAG: hypothetical protein LBE12_18270 [Planctomycetaceae bacterium]|nr:hypothetical protein [Planctomycetaceae bacterium]
MPQADYYHNGNNSACGTIHSQLSTLNYQLSIISPRAGLCSVGYFDRRLRCATPTVMHISSLWD